MSERERSFWGWGWADELPDADARRGFGKQVQGMLGFTPSEVREPPALESIALPTSRVESPALTFVTDAHEARVRHTYGRSYRDIVRGFHGEFGSAPDLVATPTDEDEVDALLCWAADANVAVIPFGGGTSVVGGVEARIGDGFRGAVSLDLRGLSGVLEVDDVSRLARIRAGTLGPALEAQLGARGMTLRCYPQSFEFSTLGGWLATRAGGHFATVYTHVDDLCASIRALTPRGVWESRRLPGSGAGPSPDRMLLGSEGTLGILTEAWMRIRPRPRHRATTSAFFDDFSVAVSATRALAQSGLFPSNCRLLDSREAALNFVANDGSSVLIVGFESAVHRLEPFMEAALAILREHGARLPKPPTYRDSGQENAGGAAGTWKAAFKRAPYMMNSLATLGILVDTFETACTWAQFDALHEAIVNGVRERMKEVCGGGFLSCRFTHVYPDGPAPYYTFLAPTRFGAEVEHWDAIKGAASDALLAHGATITHHHAVGRVHRPWYEAQRPEPFARALRAAKRELDPTGMLNPGVLFAR